MLPQGIIDGCSVPVVFCSKTQCAGNGFVLIKHCNAVAGHHRNARRVGLSAPMAMFRLLQRAMAIRCEAGLALNTDKPTELINNILREH